MTAAWMEQEVPTIRVDTLMENELVSGALVTLHGLNARVLNKRSTMTYEVLCGEGEMEVGGTFYDLRPGVVVTIPHGTPYHDEGDVRMLVSAEPPFDSADIEYVS